MVVHVKFFYSYVIDRNTVKHLCLLLTEVINVNRPRLLLIILINTSILAEVYLLYIGETVRA
jgi:hypothetical protein